MSRPIQRARVAKLDQLGEEQVFRLYLEHGSIPKLCKEIFTPRGDGEEPGRGGLYEWLHATPERWTRWQRVKETRGDIEVDMALDEAQAATTENVGVQRLKVDVHKWRAGILNRDYRPGQSQVQVNVGVAVGTAWMDALSKIGQVPTIKAEVVDK